MSDLTDRIRAKHPGAYDDMDDATLEQSVLAKHPQYKDLASKPENRLDPTQFEDHGILSTLYDTASKAAHSDIARRFLVGPSEEELGNHKLVALGASPEQSVFPDLKQPETWLGGFGKSLYDDFIKPLGTPSGFIGASAPAELPRVKPSSKVVEAIGEPWAELPHRPDLVPVGHEDVFNASRPIEIPKAAPEEIAYDNILEKRGGTAPEFIPDTNTDILAEAPKIENKPTATYAFDWPEVGGPQFNVAGGEFDGSTVGLERLKELGIDIPEIPETPVRARGEDLAKAAREKAGLSDIFNEPSSAKVGDKVKIGADIESLGKVLGSSLYSGDISTIATKELLQNSIDAIRHLGTEGKVKVNFHQGTNPFVEVADNGKGLTRQELETVFTDLGSSGKRTDANAIGGFGLAKAAPLLGGESSSIVTVARDPVSGQLIEHKFSGTPDELLAGVDIQSRVMPEGTPTGTTVRVQLPEKSSTWSAKRFVENLREHSDFPGNLEVGSRYSNTGDFSPEELRRYQPGKEVTTLSNEYANTKLITPHNEPIKETGSIELLLRNNGMYQGSTNMYLPSAIEAPNRIIVDINSKVPEGNANYPFTANREALRGTVKSDVEKYITENIVNPAIKKRTSGIQALYDNMGKAMLSLTEKFHYHDTGAKYTAQELNAVVNSKPIRSLASQINSTIDETLKSIGNPEWLNRLERKGIIFDENLRGIHIPNPATKKSAILINPLQIMSKLSPDEASAGFVHTILHEIGHIEPMHMGNAHNESFTVRLGDIYEKFGARRTVKAQEDFLNAVSRNGEYTPEVQELLRGYQESRGRGITKDDALTRTGVSSKVGPERPEGISSSNKPNGKGTSKPRVRLDSETGAWIPVDENGKQIGPAYFPGKELRPDLAKSSKYGQAAADVQSSGKIQSAWDLARGTMSVDLPFMTSAAFRQAAPLVGTKAWFKSFIPAAKAFGSEAASNAIMDGIHQQPLFAKRLNPVNGQKMASFAEEAGVKLRDLGKSTTRDEQIRSELAERIPLYGKYIRASNRAYNAFLNTIHSQTFTSLINDATKEGLSPRNNLPLAREIAEFTNTATGRGKLGFEVGSHKADLEKNVKLLSNIFFSPRKMASDIRLLNPSTYMTASPFARKQYVQSMLRRLGTWGTIASAAYMAGADVSLDMNSADFGKIKIGNTRIDPPGGLQQFIVLAHKTLLPQSLGGGGTTSTTTGRFTPFGTGFKPETRLSQVGNFLENRLHPTLKMGTDLFSATEKEPFHVGDRMIQAIAPMYLDDIVTAVQDDNDLDPVVKALFGVGIGSLSSLGMGTQTYERGSYGKPVYMPEDFDVNIGAR